MDAVAFHDGIGRRPSSCCQASEQRGGYKIRDLRSSEWRGRETSPQQVPPPRSNLCSICWAGLTRGRRNRLGGRLSGGRRVCFVRFESCLRAAVARRPRTLAIKSRLIRIPPGFSNPQRVATTCSTMSSPPGDCPSLVSDLAPLVSLVFSPPATNHCLEIRLWGSGGRPIIAG